jgi:hypothetical protein
MEIEGLKEVIHDLNAIQDDLAARMGSAGGHFKEHDDVDAALSNVDDAVELLEKIDNQIDA